MTQRYSQRAFPAYRYLPGRAPHPTRDPAGHSYNGPDYEVESFSPDDWQSCYVYLYAIDLLNQHYWWEAHEALEALWFASGQRKTATGLFIQGLLQIGVGAMKHHLGQKAAADRLWQAAVEKINVGQRYFLGLDVQELRQVVQELINGEREELPELVLHFDTQQG